MPAVFLPASTLSRYSVILFDLDGTLADTAGDLAQALNRMREARSLPAMSLERLRPHASAGARGMLRAGFGLDPEHAEFEAMRTEFLDRYGQDLMGTTVLFPGIAELLASIEAAGLRWGIVTNKPERFTLPVLRGLELLDRAACVISGDSTPHPKPHPAPLQKACTDLRETPRACLYVGDDERDVISARAAGMDVMIAQYGYLGENSHPEAWGADGMVQSAWELAEIIGVEREAV